VIGITVGGEGDHTAYSRVPLPETYRTPGFNRASALERPEEVGRRMPTLPSITPETLVLHTPVTWLTEPGPSNSSILQLFNIGLCRCILIAMLGSRKLEWS